MFADLHNTKLLNMYLRSQVSVVDSSGNVEWESQGRQPPLWPGEDHPGVLPTFNAYSATGFIKVRQMCITVSKHRQGKRKYDVIIYSFWTGNVLWYYCFTNLTILSIESIWVPVSSSLLTYLKNFRSSPFFCSLPPYQLGHMLQYNYILLINGRFFLVEVYQLGFQFHLFASWPPKSIRMARISISFICCLLHAEIEI